MTRSDDDLVAWAIGRVRRHRIAAALILIGVLVMALESVTGATGRLVAATRMLFAPDPLKGIPSTATFQEWAIAYGRARTPQQEQDYRVDSRFEQANALSGAAYASLRDSLHEACAAYRKHVTPNLYVDLPEMPENVFGPAAARYRGGITFSRYCSWGIFMENPPEATGAGPIMRIVFMDGDGSVRGGSEIGSLRAWYDFEASAVQLRSTGVVAPILEALPPSVPDDEFGRAAKFIAKLLVENQIEVCQVE